MTASDVMLMRHFLPGILQKQLRNRVCRQSALPALPLCMNTIVGEVRQQIGGQSYSSGAPVGRVLEIWQKGAPSIAAFGADIYQEHKSGYLATCESHARLGNPLFIPETGTGGKALRLIIFMLRQITMQSESVDLGRKVRWMEMDG